MTDTSINTKTSSSRGRGFITGLAVIGWMIAFGLFVVFMLMYWGMVRIY